MHTLELSDVVLKSSAPKVDSVGLKTSLSKCTCKYWHRFRSGLCQITLEVTAIAVVVKLYAPSCMQGIRSDKTEYISMMGRTRHRRCE